MTRERKKTEARQDEILRAALKVVDEEGIQALTLRRVADRIGISEAALFRHFDSKDDIVNAMARWLIEECVAKEEEKGDPQSTLLGLMRRQFQAFQDFPDATSVFFQEETFRGFPKAKEAFDERRRERAKWITAFLKRMRADGKLPENAEPDVLARIYMGAMRMEVLEWRSAGFSYDLVARAGPIMSQLSGLLSPDERAKRKR